MAENIGGVLDEGGCESNGGNIGRAMREKGSGGRPQIIYDWFVRYNPIYLFSALCFLAGVFVLSQGLQDMNWKTGQTILAATVQAYELMLIAFAAILYRFAHEKRAAMILGILEIIFLFDPTFRLEAIPGVRGQGIATSIGLILVFPAKIAFLLWAFKIGIRVPLVVLPSVAYAIAAVMPHILLYMVSKPVNGVLFVHYISILILFGLIAAVFVLRPKIFKRDENEKPLNKNLAWAVFYIIAALVIVHIVVWMVQFRIHFTIAHLAPALMLAPFVLKRQKESVVWAACFVAGALGLFIPEVFVLICAAGASVFTVMAFKNRHFRLLIGTSAALFVGANTIGWGYWPFPEPGIVYELILFAILISLGIWKKLPSAYVAAFAGMILIFIKIFPKPASLFPDGNIGWGIALLAGGFLLLGAGLAVNLLWNRLSRQTNAEKESNNAN